jgi:hypothetical protein
MSRIIRRVIETSSNQVIKSVTSIITCKVHTESVAENITPRAFTAKKGKKKEETLVS